MHEALKILLPMTAVYGVVLAVTLFVIKRLLLNDSLNAVNRIKQVEVEVRKKEEGIRREIEEHEKEFARRKAEAEEELQRQKDASEKELARLREQVMGDAKKEAGRIMDQAKKNEEKFRQQIAQQMEEKAVDYAGEVFKLVFSEQMNEQLNRQFVEELLGALDGVDAGSITVDAKEAAFTSSHPLDPEQKQRLEKLLAEKFGAEIRVNETIHQNLIAGLIFKVGSLEIDGSLLNRFQEAVAELKRNVKV